MAQHPTDPLRVFAELGRIKLSETDLDGVLNQVAHLAQRSLPGADEVSVTIVDKGHPYTGASVGDLARQLDEWQYDQRSGPCLQAATERRTVTVPDTATDPRWNG